MTTEQAQSVEELLAVKAEWAQLWRRCPSATVFQGPEWLIPWWKHLGEGSLCVLLFRDAGELVGLAPLYIYSGATSVTRRVFLLGTGNTDYLDVLFAPGWETRCAARMLQQLGARSSAWDLCEFHDVRPSSPLLSMAIPPGWKSEVKFQEPCPVMSLGNGTARPEDVIPAPMFQKLAYYRRRLGRMGRARFEPVGATGLEEALESLFQLHERRWGERGQQGVLNNPRVKAFHREVVRETGRAGTLRLHLLRVGERVAGVLYGFYDGRWAYYYLSGFAPEFAKLSPGVLMIGHAIEEAIREGAREFDFLRGREPYKYTWGAKERPNYMVSLRHGT